jgi:hypothetical protein
VKIERCGCHSFGHEPNNISFLCGGQRFGCGEVWLGTRSTDESTHEKLKINKMEQKITLVTGHELIITPETLNQTDCIRADLKTLKIPRHLA